MREPAASPGDEFADLEAGLAAAWSAVRAGRPAEDAALGLAAATSATRRIECAGPERRAAMIDRCAAAVSALDDRARALLEGHGVGEVELALGIGLVRAEARLVRRATRAVEAQPQLDDSAFRLIELQDAENSLRARFAPPRQAGSALDDDPPPPPGAAGDLARELRSGRLLLLTRQAERRLDAARPLAALDSASAPAAFALYRALDSSHRELSLRRADSTVDDAAPLEAALHRVEEERARLEREFFAFAERVRDAAGLDVLRAAARGLERELDEARVLGLEPADEPRVARLRHLQLLGERFRRVFRGVLAANNAPPAPELSRLETVLARVRHVAADRVLDLRLQRIFGVRLVRAWDTLVFWLIISVLGLIAIDHYRDADAPGVIHWTIWVDTAICGILLLDFGTRLVLSPSPLRYFQRHFLTELVPALPYGLIANLHQLTAIESIRSLRLVRTLTLLQALRPLIRIGRLFLFVARAADRLVDQNAWLLNQNIVFFTDAVADDAVPTTVKRARELESWIGRQANVAASQLSPAEALRCAGARLALVAAESAADSEPQDDAAKSPLPGLEAPEPRFLDVDDVVHRLRELDSAQVAEFVGVDFAQQLTDSLRFFRLPWLRKLPVVRFVLGDSGVPDPLETTARLGRVAGDVLELAQRTVNWFADFYGTITPSQFLDRVGAQVVRATAVPARRLLLFGSIFGVAMLLVTLTRSETLDRAAGFLFRFLSLPVLVLGGLCLVPLAIGTWFRRIARQAADFYDRVAEAQFLGLTEIMKERTREADLQRIAKRVVAPEAILSGRDPERDEAAFVRRGASADVRCDAADAAVARFEIALLFHRDFMDGAFFHRTDVKVANLLLGNVTLDAVRRDRLRWPKRRLARLESVDFARGRGGLGGSAVWFQCITHSVAQNVARLILEYNRNCLTLDEVACATEEDRERFERWLARRETQSLALSRGEAVLPVDATGAPGAPDERAASYRTAEFHALHFLAVDPERDEAVRRRFGDRVLEFLREDRRNLVRVVFGTFPMRELPRERRTFNAYEAYRRQLSRGRMFLFPLKLLWYALVAIRRLVGLLVSLVREVLRRDTEQKARASGHASFQVARRKIHRMRRPVAMEALRLRAEFDPEYLGLPLPDRRSEIPPALQFGEDLRSLDASEREWEEFRRLKSRRQQQLRSLARVLRLLERRAAPLGQSDRRDSGLCDSRSGEATRAIALAWLCDHEEIASRVAAFENLRELLHRVELAPPRKRSRWALPRVGTARVRDLVARAWPSLAQGGVETADAELRRRFEAALLSTDAARRADLDLLLRHAASSAEDVYERARRVLAAVAARPSSFGEQLIAVRAVQSIAMLDVAGYERLVATLGEFER